MHTTITPEHTLAPELGDQLGDDVLLTVAANTKVAKVTPSVTERRSAVWRSSRAWSASGNVD